LIAIKQQHEAETGLVEPGATELLVVLIHHRFVLFSAAATSMYEDKIAHLKAQVRTCIFGVFCSCDGHALSAAVLTMTGYKVQGAEVIVG